MHAWNLRRLCAGLLQVAKKNSSDGAESAGVRAGSSYLSQSERTVTFGLGAAAAADSLAVRWPSGAEQVFRGLVAGRTYRLVEGQAEGATADEAEAGAGPGGEES